MVLLEASCWAQGQRRGASLAEVVAAASLLAAVTADDTFLRKFSLLKQVELSIETLWILCCRGMLPFSWTAWKRTSRSCLDVT
jgi:hypothetical protein